VRSRTCISVGMIPSFMRTIIAPAHPISSAVTRSPYKTFNRHINHRQTNQGACKMHSGNFTERDVAITISPSRFLISFRSVVRARIAITSLPTYGRNEIPITVAVLSSLQNDTRNSTDSISYLQGSRLSAFLKCNLNRYVNPHIEALGTVWCARWVRGECGWTHVWVE
jgi:hypothetical protein